MSEQTEVKTYENWPEAFEELLKDLKFPNDNDAAKRMLLKMTISSLLHY